MMPADCTCDPLNILLCFFTARHLSCCLMEQILATASPIEILAWNPRPHKLYCCQKF